ncbi:NAD(P)H-dependent flavin oxidoreductase [Secundilactobacillus mixtipabuli]|uniref:Probable nitronate monooxygenase n=1 Tax=Secundilactobacillus mixtipabuli TaxID=1435342 RepID=A0A1Z5ICE6_9LACO|nr:nitronate monooxygenase [Secundilactobacillus mixtipabuli]GAW99318.1 enoyl-ACP reductase 2 [Secundilactobacillus mixtipabuli]
MTNRVAQILKIEKPIIQGPLLWLTDAKLVAAVSNAGGLGVLGFNAGQTTVTHSLDETMARVRNEIHKIRQLTDKPFGLNLAMSNDPHDTFFEPTLKLMIEEQVPVAVCAGDLNADQVAEIKAVGITVVFRPITPTVEITKQAKAAGVDIFVATGFDEGGTVPTKVVGTLSAVPMTVDAADDMPVMAAGGIADARTAKAVFALGAEGLYVGTAFMMSEESRMAENIKELALKSDADDLLMYRTVPAYYRSLPGEMPNKMVQLDAEGASREDIYQTAAGYDGMRLGMLVGDLSKGFASFGLGISQIHKIEPVSVIMDRLNAGVPVEN